MRLLHTGNLHFEEFYDAQIPRYAILSHRWGDQEVSFKEMRKPSVVPPGPGMAKLEGFCRLAAEHGFDWCWIDTCCIDKRSSADLSEAINSMFNWYAQAARCYVYLSDITFTPHELYLKTECEEERWLADGWPSLVARFQNSSWFTRGWTLQELIAPEVSNVYFFDGNWNGIGSLPQLETEISRITGIESNYFGYKSSRLYSRSFARADASIAKRMSWVSHRQTSRGEDMAYCLLGLFDVNMPLLYGEGAVKAFYRLQLEILKQTNDESLFAWAIGRSLHGMLAPSPTAFSGSNDIVQGVFGRRPPYSITNQGLEISIPSSHIFEGNDPKRQLLESNDEPENIDIFSNRIKRCVIYLDCHREKDPMKPLVIQLSQIPGMPLYRTKCDTLDQSELPSIFQNYTFQNLTQDLRDTTLVRVENPLKPIAESFDLMVHYMYLFEKFFYQDLVM
ncbi:MAG: hypothetical protein HETSPECPRED_007925 [Heterodermia speciosa]|uniref:Heterokaryon incompatibility domain-containing protein n=1 Tax=Heterodermia speciosa TaxID=116794 RepID=A0A8H3EIN9_9LECA|nr:MAG: hypothetical protein HETSPECPRED_007925 [Heterodermia speciosa]